MTARAATGIGLRQRLWRPARPAPACPCSGAPRGAPRARGVVRRHESRQDGRWGGPPPIPHTPLHASTGPAPAGPRAAAAAPRFAGRPRRRAGDPGVALDPPGPAGARGAREMVARAAAAAAGPRRAPPACPRARPGAPAAPPPTVHLLPPKRAARGRARPPPVRVPLGGPASQFVPKPARPGPPKPGHPPKTGCRVRARAARAAAARARSTARARGPSAPPPPCPHQRSPAPRPPPRPAGPSAAGPLAPLCPQRRFRLKLDLLHGPRASPPRLP
jgi:hypothetical protein